MSLIGYARVSTEDQATDAQVDAIVKQSKALIKKHNSSMQCCAVGASFEITV